MIRRCSAWNDDVRMTDEDRIRVRTFLDTRFPEKSSFEK